jgi:hypothetical protein
VKDGDFSECLLSQTSPVASSQLPTVKTEKIALGFMDALSAYWTAWSEDGVGLALAMIVFLCTICISQVTFHFKFKLI